MSKNNSSKTKNNWSQCQKCLVFTLQKPNNNTKEEQKHDCNQIDYLIEINKSFLFKNLASLTSIEHTKGIYFSVL
jgi:hypothetical protein